jgi:superfamily II DNA or RNA helicase
MEESRLFSSKFQLRKHQLEAIQAANRFFFDSNSNKPSGLICLPTGGGKTITAISFIADAINNGKIASCLWVVHREELCNQAVDTFSKFGINTSRWTATEKTISDVTVCMVQSTKLLGTTVETPTDMVPSKHIFEDRKDFDLIVIDEAHHVSVAERDYENTYIKLLKKMRYKYLLGLTATPIRLDNKVLNFDKVIYSTTFFDMVQQGYLAKPNYHEIRTERYFQLSGGSKNDFTQKSLGCLDDEERNEKIVTEWINNKEKFGKTLIFCVSVNHCKNLQDKFKKLDNVATCAIVTGNTPKATRNGIISQFDNNEIDILLNCQVFTEGFDSPTIETVIVARPTMSESLFMQMIGRGSRITETKKEYNLVVVVDDVQRFATIVKQWKPLLVGKTKEDIEQEKFELDLKNASESLNQIISANLINARLGDISPIDVEAVLTINGRYKQNQSFIIDRDRNDCLRRLFYYAHGLSRMQKTSHRQEYIESYTLCVPQNEFTHKEWESIAYAWYDNYINNKKTITIDKEDEPYKVWHRIPIVEFSNKDKEIIKKRIKRSLDIASVRNRAFNQKYSNPNQLLKELIDILKSTNPKKYKSTLAVYSNIENINCKDRNITVQTSLTRGDRFYMGAISNASKAISAVLSEYISDPCCKVKFKMKGYYG